MDKVKCKLTVFFEEPFWIGVLEQMEKDRLSVCRIVFGTQPKDYEIQEFILRNYCKLKFSPSVDMVMKPEKTNPKKIQREVRKQTMQRGIGKKSWQALKLQREEHKLERKAVSKEQQKAEKQRQFDLKQQKRKEKHRGR